MKESPARRGPGQADPERRPHRRAESEAGSPGDASAVIIDLPATAVNPSDISSLNLQLPGVDELPELRGGRVVSRPGQAPASLSGLLVPRRPKASSDPALEQAPSALQAPGADEPASVDEAPVGSPGYRTDDGGLPVGPDGAPLTRRQLRELRRQEEDRAAADSGQAVDGTEITEESLAREAAGLADRFAEAGDDPDSVDPVLLREQEALAEKARRFNDARAAADREPMEDPPVPVTGSAGVAPATAHEPVQADSAHGLDSLPASVGSSRDRTILIVAGMVFVILVIALIIALVL